MLNELQQPRQNRRADAGPCTGKQHRRPEACGPWTRERRRDRASDFLLRIQILHPI